MNGDHLFFIGDAGSLIVGPDGEISKRNPNQRSIREIYLSFGVADGGMVLKASDDLGFDKIPSNTLLWRASITPDAEVDITSVDMQNGDIYAAQENTTEKLSYFSEPIIYRTHADGSFLVSQYYSVSLRSGKNYQGSPIIDDVTGKLVGFSDQDNTVWLQDTNISQDLSDTIQSVLQAEKGRVSASFISFDSNAQRAIVKIEHLGGSAKIAIINGADVRTDEGFCLSDNDALFYQHTLFTGDTKAFVYGPQDLSEAEDIALFFHGGPGVYAGYENTDYFVDHLLKSHDAVVVFELAGDLSANPMRRYALREKKGKAISRDLVQFNRIVEAQFTKSTMYTAYYSSYGGVYFSGMNASRRGKGLTRHIKRHVLVAPWLKPRPYEVGGASASSFHGSNQSATEFHHRQRFGFIPGNDRSYLDRYADKLQKKCSITGVIEAHFGGLDEFSQSQDLGACTARADVTLYPKTVHSLVALKFKDGISIPLPDDSDKRRLRAKPRTDQ